MVIKKDVTMPLLQERHQVLRVNGIEQIESIVKSCHRRMAGDKDGRPTSLSVRCLTSKKKAAQPKLNGLPEICKCWA